MQLNRVKLVNFRQHADTEIVLGQGITALVGPNGSGKSTMLEAIAWAFYGSPAARGTRESIRRFQAPARSQVRVEVEFTLGAHEFCVARGLYGAELYQDKQPAPVAKSQQEVTSRVTRILGMSREEFFNTYFTGQKELAVMANLGPTDRARFLSRILGYDKLKRAQDRLRETRSRTRAELAGLEQGLGNESDLANDVSLARERLHEVDVQVSEADAAEVAARRLFESETPTWERMQQLRDSVLSLDGERRVAERDVLEAGREFERLDRQLAEALDAQAQLEQLADVFSRIDPLKDEMAQLDRDAQAADRRRILTGQQAEVEEQRKRIRARIAEIGDAASALSDTGDELADARKRFKDAELLGERAHTAWIRDKQDAETKRQALRDQYRELQTHREHIVDAGPDGKCPTCARPLDEEYSTVLETLDRQLEEIEINGKYFAQRVTQLEREPEDVRETDRATSEASRRVEAAVQALARCEDRVRERTQAESELKRLQERAEEISEQIAALPETYDAERHDIVRQELRELEPTIRRGVELEVKSKRAEQLVKEAEVAEKAVSDVENRFKQLEQAIADLGYREAEFEQARQRFEAAEVSMRHAELRATEIKGDRKAAAEGLRLAEGRLAERKERAKRIEELRDDVRLHDELDRAFHDLRLELNSSMQPEIAERASEFLADLTDGRYNELELDDQFRIFVIEDGLPKSVISGGEEDLANLVIRLAISQMVAERAGQPLSLLVLDEIFGSLDESRRVQVIELLRRLSARFPQVVLITHIETVKDGVDRLLRVSYDQREATSSVAEDVGVPAI